MAEPNGTGDPKTVALALAKRPGTILKAIKDQNLELPRWWEDVDDPRGDGDDTKSNARQKIARDEGGSGIMPPPPLDPLHNLEIVIGGTYTVGRLVSVPSRRYQSKSGGKDKVATLLDYEKQGNVVTEGGPGYFQYNLQDDMVMEDSGGNNEDVEDQVSAEELAKAEEDAAKAAAEAEAAKAEAKRKEEKMKMCK